MRARTAFVIALLALPWWNAQAPGQETPRPVYPPTPKEAVLPSPLDKSGEAAPTHVYAENGRTGLSDWITYRNRSCDAAGVDPGIQTEIYLRVGPSFPFGGDLFGDILSTGWMIQGGGKALFYDPPHIRAWFVDLSLANIYNHTNGNAPNNPVFVANQFATIREYNRTFVGLGLGRMWYLRGDGLSDGPAWRASVDMGGRWGSGCVDFNFLQHRSDVIGGVYFGLQTDVEMPMRCAPCVFVFGLRTEWAYTWSDVLEQQSDVQDINLLFHLGVRY